MRVRIVGLLLPAAVLIGSASVTAEEAYQRIIDGLRDRGYYDYAVFYLDTLAQRTDLPADVRALLPFERAMLLKESARLLRSPEAQSRQLDEALAYLERFVQDNPRHEKVGDANSEMARILLEKAEAEIWKARSPANTENRAEFQSRAREMVQRARKIFETALEQHRTRYKSFPAFIPETETEQRRARDEAVNAYIQSQLDLAKAIYQEAQTYDRDSPEYRKLLTEAAEEFDKIHAEHRGRSGAEYARLWQGKCFEEQDDIVKALGLYNELLDHPGTSPTMLRLKDQALHFRLICLNHPKRRDYVLVINEAREWLNRNRRKARSRTGLGIRWELTQALLARAEDPKADLSDNERKELLREAYDQAREINRFPGKYKDASTFLIRDLLVKLRGDAGDPEDFDTALGLARSRQDDLRKLEDRIEAARQAGKNDELAKLEQERIRHLKETVRILQLALSLADETTPTADLHQARFLLALSFLRLRRNYEAAAVAEYLVQHARKDLPELALDAAYLAMAAFVQSYNDLPDDQTSQKETELALMRRACETISQGWPESDRANEARFNMGQVYSDIGRPLEAAQWYAAVSETSPQYERALISAGLAFWEQYRKTAFDQEGEKPPAETLNGWLQEAEKRLTEGIRRMQESVSSEAEPPAELIGAKLTMAQIRILAGDFPAAIDWLTKPPHSVMQAISVPQGTNRPARGVKSREFAALALQLLLRAYVGVQKLDEARAVVAQLERLGSGTDGASMTDVFVQFGRELENEIRRLKAAGDNQRLAEVRNSFDQFLQQMAQRPDQTYRSLKWIAETYFGLGQGSEGEAGKAAEYFGRAAAAYEQILQRAENDPEFLDASARAWATLRLVQCKRRQKVFPEALELVTSILKEKPKWLDAQIEAAYVLQDWGSSGQPDALPHLLEAIEGLDAQGQEKLVWGWGHIALLLQQNLLMSSQPQPDYEHKHLEARYNIAQCRYNYAMAQTSTSRKNVELDKARQEIRALVAVTANMDDTWWNKFDALYRRILEAKGDPVVPLERPQEPVAVADSGASSKQGAKTASRQSGGSRSPADRTPQESSSGGGGAIWLLLTMVVGIACAVGVYMLMARPKQRPKYLVRAAGGGRPPVRRTPTAPTARPRNPSKS